MSGRETTELYRFKDRDEYIKALDSVILTKDIQERDIGSGKKHRYFPVAIKDAIADYVFQNWNVIDEKYNVMNGMLVCTIKLTYTPSYPGADELFCTGSAAVLIQSAKNSLEYQLPAVESEAIGRALSKLGNIFGRNLSRKLNKNVMIPDDFKLRKHEKEEVEVEVEVEPKIKESQEKPKIDAPF